MHDDQRLADRHPVNSRRGGARQALSRLAGFGHGSPLPGSRRAVANGPVWIAAEGLVAIARDADAPRLPEVSFDATTAPAGLILRAWSPIARAILQRQPASPRASAPVATPSVPPTPAEPPVDAATSVISMITQATTLSTVMSDPVPDVTPAPGIDPVVTGNAVSPATAMAAGAAMPAEGQVPALRAAAPAVLVVCSGSATGCHVPLDQPLIPLGDGRGQLAVIANRGNQWFLTHVEGAVYPRVNTSAIGLGAWHLRNGDLIALGGVCFRFATRA